MLMFLGVVAPTRTHADLITQTVDLLNPSWPPPQSAVFFMEGSTSFDQFDPALGTLTGVSFQLVSTPNIGFIYKGLSAPGTETMDYFLSGPDFAGVIYFAGAVLPKSTNYSTSAQYSTFYSDPNTSPWPTDLSKYVGTDSVSLEAQITKGWTDEGLTNVGFRNFVSVVGGSVAITYDYIPAAVPEPATLALLAGGLGSLGLARRRQGCERAAS
jgi:hypothetical protein